MKEGGEGFGVSDLVAAGHGSGGSGARARAAAAAHLSRRVAHRPPRPHTNKNSESWQKKKKVWEGRKAGLPGC